MRRGVTAAAVSVLSLSAWAALAPAVAAGPAPADPVAPPGSASWTSYGYPRSWRPDDGAAATDARARTIAATPPTVVAAPTWAPTAAAVRPPARPALSGGVGVSEPRRVVGEAPRGSTSWADAAGGGAGCAPPPCAPPPCEPAPCEPCDPCRGRFELWARGWLVTPSGDTLITLGGEPGTGTTIDLEDDLDTEDGSGVAVGIAWRFWGRHRVFVEYEALSFEGKNRLPQDEVFHGKDYPSGERVQSDLDLRMWKGGWDYGLFACEGAEVRAGVSAWWWTFEQRLQGLDSGLNESRDFSHVLPVANVSAEGTWQWLHGFARASYGIVGADRWALDLAVGGGVRLLDHFTIDLGWRWFRFVFDETTNEGDLTFTGPFLEVGIDV